MYDQRCKYVNMHVNMLSNVCTCIYLQIYTWKANEREAKQLKLILHLHSEVYVCQKGPPALASLQKLLHEWPELQGSLCHWKPEFWRSLLTDAGI